MSRFTSVPFPLLGENLHRNRRGRGGRASLLCTFLLFECARDIPQLLPALTLSTSVAFQFRTCRAVSLVAEGGRPSIISDSRARERHFRWKFHRWGGGSSGSKATPPAPSSRLAYSSYVYSTIWQDRPGIDPPPPPNAWPESIPSTFPTDERKIIYIWIIYIFRIERGEVRFKS